MLAAPPTTGFSGGDPSPPGGGVLSMYGIHVGPKGELKSEFSVPLILVNILGMGLTWFVALAWSNAFNEWLNEYRKKNDLDKRLKSPVEVSLIVAAIATVMVIVIIYLIIKAYRMYQSYGIHK